MQILADQRLRAHKSNLDRYVRFGNEVDRDRAAIHPLAECGRARSITKIEAEYFGNSGAFCRGNSTLLDAGSANCNLGEVHRLVGVVLESLGLWVRVTGGRRLRRL